MSLDDLEPVPLAGNALLELCERCESLPAPQRALAILGAAYPAADERAVFGERLGAWHAALLRARSASIGGTLEMLDRCPSCAERVELSVAAGALLKEARAAAQRELSVVAGSLHILCRPLTGADWIESFESTAEGAVSAAKRLLGRAVLSVREADTEKGLEDLSDAHWEAIAGQLAEADPLSEILFGLCCPRCAESWDVVLDPADYFYRELAASSRRLLLQIHALAGAYGWTEAEILALGASRRAAYVKLIDEQRGGSPGLGRAL
jgi:hypothetical protein